LAVLENVALPVALRMLQHGLECSVDTGLRTPVVEHRDGGIVELLEQVADRVRRMLGQIPTLVFVVLFPVVR